MRLPRPQPWGLGLLLVLLPGALRAGPPPRLLSSPAENHRSLQYHFTAVSAPAAGTPAFWVSGWLGPQQYLSYNNLRGQAEPCGAWVWESQVSWYWEKETTDLRYQQTLFLQALQALGEGPFTMQGLLGCELGPDNVSVPVAKFALNGEEFMMFDPKLGIWDGDWPESRTVSIKWTQQPEAVNKEKTFLLYSCPHRLLGHLERGRGNLEWKEPPSMRLKARPGSPGLSVLTCSAFSFYPPELKLRFLRNELATGSGEIHMGPNGDGSFYAWSSLTVKSGDEHHYRCVVQHAGLAQPLTVELGLYESCSTALCPPLLSKLEHRPLCCYRITSQDLGASGWNRHRLLAAPDSGCGRSSPVEKDEEGAASSLDLFPWGGCRGPPAHSQPVQGW
ncbi:IgG receptor FcRn large subunit p51 isoform X1 [Cervus canadensis]|uniref:IgG receptor FcRn large subunit p51 isoform X1 n=1 Tax=Cervus canadensis TaxID=1574408 RepID=UPI001CA36B45|nr:IgG receptor FcRn large subunit p51 isoform X1 [Cervus canadensis]XP_043291255.1 IgG receptor FcRn large subunit p51 isoform X1 [Cervus canadensis]